MILAASAVVKCLEEEDISIVFGYPGAAICPVYDALSHSNIRHILVRQEQNAGHAASGYARITQKPAVCIATSGPGALNLITAIATAYMDSIPLVVITGQVSRDCLGRDVFQEADITGAAEPFVKHSYLVENAADIPRIFKEAFFIASTGRQGPVLIDIPFDIQNEEIKYEYQDKISITGYDPSPASEDLNARINQTVAALSAAKRPLICAGGGIFASNAQAELMELSQSANIPIVTTMMGISAISPVYPLNLGLIGMHGNSHANKAMNKADLLILVGARVGDRAIMSPLGLSKTAVIIHIDIDPAEIGKNIVTDIPITGDAKLVLSSLAAAAKKLHFEDWISGGVNTKKLKIAENSGFVNPATLMYELCKKAGGDTVITADVGQNLIWAARGYNIKAGRFLTSGGMGTMGYSLPAAIGAKLATNQATAVIAICGDGGFQMSFAELATICQNNLAIKIILLNNSCLGMIKELQDSQYNKNETAVSLSGSPDYTALAHAYGIAALQIKSNSEIESAITQMLESVTPFLLECVVDSDERSL